MNPTLYKAKQILTPLLKVSVLIICVYFLYRQWEEQPPSIDQMWEQFHEIPWWTLPLMIIISFASWMVESKKWQFLVMDVYGISFRESVTQNLTAQAASYITPLRSGEFVAKALYFPATQRKEITQRVFAGNYSQMAITLILGFAALFFHPIFDAYLRFTYGVVITLVISSLLMLIVFLLYLWIFKQLKIAALPIKLWTSTLYFSLLRYLIFASNWFIILYVLGYESSLFDIIINVVLLYLAISIIPMIQLLDMPLRWSLVGLIFAGQFYDADILILATTIVWITNSVVPTLLGCALLPFQKLKWNAA